MIEPAFEPPALPASPAPGDWQPLPRRGALLYAGGLAISLTLPLVFVAGTVGAKLLDSPRWLLVVLAAAAGLLVGGGIGRMRHRRIGWKLDDDGFATRRGGWWRSETLVPVSRVQHLDLERGPLERRLGLATLVVHTAGTRMAAVKLPLLALEDAELLRDRLARQVEHDDAL
ncbi:membrane-flanked domain [Pseudoxanthomonas suwonensis 11-1]|uniref:Membrane-flanked domain n=1 Tax=Pseudoxanthomonas suwonensis (strain 11-1) TaxID=743721 RepID=E6WX12_PSEUU|nr:PH domain-containing protein [Pseudoxanthomonas suwonensis]ADV28711.1 membrane-flanked domain [Pseudoxanthomonas suwonensis 11-1]